MRWFLVVFIVPLTSIRWASLPISKHPDPDHCVIQDKRKFKTRISSHLFDGIPNIKITSLFTRSFKSLGAELEQATGINGCNIARSTE